MISKIDNAISTKYVNKIIKIRRLWVIQKNIEAEEKWAQKKEEQEKRIKRNNNQFNGTNFKNKVHESMDFYSAFFCN